MMPDIEWTWDKLLFVVGIPAVFFYLIWTGESKSEEFERQGDQNQRAGKLYVGGPVAVKRQ